VHAAIKRVQLKHVIDDAVCVAAQRNFADRASKIASEPCAVPAADWVWCPDVRRRPSSGQIET
jgi:hypothetical protein